MQPTTALPEPLKPSLLAQAPSGPPKGAPVTSSKATADHYGAVAWGTPLQWRTADLVLASNPGVNLIKSPGLPASLSRNDLLCVAGETLRGPLRPPSLCHLQSLSLWSSHTSMQASMQEYPPPQPDSTSLPRPDQVCCLCALSCWAFPVPAPCTMLCLIPLAPSSITHYHWTGEPLCTRATLTSLSPHPACYLAFVYSLRISVDESLSISQILRGKCNDFSLCCP